VGHDAGLDLSAGVDPALIEQTLPVLLDAAARRWPNEPVLNFFQTPGSRITFAELRSRTDRLARALIGFGVGPGTPVAVVLPNVMAFPVSWLAIARLGAVMVPINPSYTPDEIRFALEDVSVKHVIADESFSSTLSEAGLRPEEHLFCCDPEAQTFGPFGPPAAVVASVPSWPDVSPDDPVGIHYTSGTTGLPKGCVLTHRSWVVTAVVLAHVLPRAPRRLLSDAPYFYLDAPMELAFALLIGAEQYVAQKVSLSRFASWLVEYDIDYCEVWEALGDRMPDPQSEARLRQRTTPIMMSSFALPGDHHRGLEERLNAVIREMFGMTEVGLATLVSYDDDSLVGSGSCGRAAPFREVRVFDPESLAEVADDEVGELWVRGPGLLLEYYRRPEVNAECFQPGGWFRTGDLARRDCDGNFFIVGRLKDMIRRSHENIAATEVEAALAKHPAVSSVGVIGVPDELRGEEVKAFVALHEGTPASDETAQAILEFAGQHLAPFKVPRYLEVLEELPLTPSGKIAKRALRDHDTASNGSRVFDRRAGMS
jgi:long-chain acyl-CoA synthetase